MSILNSIPSEAWLVLAGTVFGMLSALLGVWLTNRSNVRLLQLQLRHESDEKEKDRAEQRHEQFYVECRKYFNDMATYYLPYQRVMQGDLTFNQALDVTNERGTPNGYDPNHVSMLVDFYFYDFKEDFMQVLSVRDRLNTIMGGFKEQYRRGDTDGGEWIKEFNEELRLLVRKMEEFEERVACYRPVDKERAALSGP